MFDESSAAGGLFSSAMDIVKMKIGQEYRAQDRKSEQDFAVGMADRQTSLDNTAVQRRMADLQAAGINPILAAGGQSAGSSTASAGGGGSYHSGGSFSKDYGAMAMASLAASQADKNSAEAERARADAENIREQTPSHAVSRDKMRQEIEQSIQQAKTLAAQEVHGYASAEQARAQTRLIGELVTQARATVQQLLSHADLQRAQKGEVDQRVKQNLPEIQRALAEIERYHKELDNPRREQDRSAHDRFTGALGALIRSLTGLGSYLK